MELFDYKKFIAQRKENAENQAREYFYNQKERKPYYCSYKSPKCTWGHMKRT